MIDKHLLFISAKITFTDTLRPIFQNMQLNKRTATTTATAAGAAAVAMTTNLDI